MSAAATDDVLERDASRVVRDAGLAPRVAIIAGSGLGDGLAAAMHVRARVPYAELAGMPRVPAVAGHAGELALGELGGALVALFSGRFHLYQGLSADQVAYPARLAHALGCETLVLTNAAGALREDLVPGETLLIRDHLNLTGANPLVGEAAAFVSMRDAWEPALRSLALEAAHELGIPLREGVYAAVLGPSYETPAEAAALRVLGADVVGMSTVPEAIAARSLGLRLLGISLVTNAAAASGLAHDDVLAAADSAARPLAELLAAILSRLG